MYDLLVIGGGPAGAATAWEGATRGLSVLVCDRSDFPRDKPCGDGLTPNAVRLIDGMGLGEELTAHHRVDRFRLVGRRGVVEGRWPDRPGVPSHGYVVARTSLDSMLLEHAASVGAEVWTSAEGKHPIIEDGVVQGAVIERDGRRCEVRARLTVAANGMSTRFGRAAGLRSRRTAPFGIATRAQVHSERADDPALEAYFTLQEGNQLLPGYGWVFPMGGGMLNIGAGYMSTYKHWRRLNVNAVMAQFIDQLPKEWKVPSVDTLLATEALRGWRLPMGLSVWPPAVPGLMAAGDAAATIKPFTGVGISKALESGSMAGRAAVEILASSRPTDTDRYTAAVRDRWGAYYRLGRTFTTIMGNPRILGATVDSAIRLNSLSSLFTTLMTGNGDFSGSGRSERVLRGVIRGVGRLPEPEMAPEDDDDPRRLRAVAAPGAPVGARPSAAQEP